MKQEKTPQIDGVIGIYRASSRGFGFLIPEDGNGRADDYFIPPRHEGGAWDGDKVCARPEEAPAVGNDRKVAAVTAVLARHNETVTGAIRKHNHEVWLQPDSDKLPGPIRVIGKTRGARVGDKAAVAMTSYGGAKLPPVGTLREIFGRDGTRAAATAAILYANDIDTQFPAAVAAQAEAIPAQVSPAACAGRRDLREQLIITIDGASAKDLDDAISLEQDAAGQFILGVHIADVSHYVPAGTPLDLEAWARGTSVYYADQVIPMLPPALSNGICSLHPQVDRLALSCIMTLGADGTVRAHELVKSVIRTTERMTYDDCNALLQGDSPALETRYAAILPMLRAMAALAQVLERRRRLRGSLDLNTKECDIVCDADGTPVALRTRTQGISEALIESFMLAANECVAEHLDKGKKPAVYRVHEKPSGEKTEALRALLAPLGYDLTTADNFSLQKILRAAEGKPEAAMVNGMVLRALMKARYDVENLGHFGLAADYYCHFTSPIRRYPDLMIHRILTALLDDAPLGKTEQKLRSAAQKAAVQSSERELAAQNAAREIEKCYQAEFMQGQLGELFPGTVAGVTRFGLFIALENGVEGFLPTEALPDDYYHYDALRMTLTGERGGRVFGFGLALTVQCVAADAGSGTVDFVPEGADKFIARRRETRERPLPTPEHAKNDKYTKKHRGAAPRAMHVPKAKKGRKK